MDDFATGNGLTANWGHWQLNFGGANSDGNMTSNYAAPGYTNYGGECTYRTDSGAYSWSEQALYFDQTTDISSYSGIFFRIQGGGTEPVYLQIDSSLADPNNGYVVWQSSGITPTSEWSSYSLDFNSFTGSYGSPPPYTLQQALQNGGGFLWNVTANGNQTGFFTLDDVYFLP